MDKKTKNKLKVDREEIKKMLYQLLHEDCSIIDYDFDKNENPIKYCGDKWLLLCDFDNCKNKDQWYVDFKKSMHKISDLFLFWGIENVEMVKRNDKWEFEFKLRDNDTKIIFKEFDGED